MTRPRTCVSVFVWCIYPSIGLIDDRMCIRWPGPSVSQVNTMKIRNDSFIFSWVKIIVSVVAITTLYNIIDESDKNDMSATTNTPIPLYFQRMYYYNTIE